MALFQRELSENELEALFSSDERCLAFLAEVKWEKGFVCRKCGNTNYCPGKSPHARRCTKCKSEESAASGTIFHNCKFPISKAFYIAYKVCKGMEEVSSYEFARRLSLRQMTCWNFKTKIQQALGTMNELTDAERDSVSRILGENPD